MKNKIFTIQYSRNLLLMLISITSFMKGQIVVDYASSTALPKDYDKTGNYYLKDVNNYLNNFMGTWEYVNGNEKFQIILTKITKYHSVSPSINVNIYRDGLSYKYKKYFNGNLVFESPTFDYPSFKSVDGKLLRGNIRDYGRVTVTVNYPQAIGGGVFIEGGAYFNADCRIELLPSVLTLNGGAEAPKIKFDLFLRASHFGEDKNPAYNGMPVFSIPNNVIMTKVP